VAAESPPEVIKGVGVESGSRRRSNRLLWHGVSTLGYQRDTISRLYSFCCANHENHVDQRAGRPTPAQGGRGRAGLSSQDGARSARERVRPTRRGPHAGFRRTKKGFEVALKNKKSRYDGLFKSHPDNHIEVTADAIIINGKRYRRSHFEGFSPGVWTYERRGARPEHMVGYTYGGEAFFLPGVWEEQQTKEIALALNLHLRDYFQSGPKNQDDPEGLRNARPTDF